ncbi:MAG: hypothetical protein MJB14_17575, partial [Spirochaetes bacterium]|nr:hypothetical protein [Spirochaetota bacterium]
INMVEALQSIATDDAVILLTTKLAYFNEKVSADFGTGYGEKEGQKIIIAIIRALGGVSKNVENIPYEQTVTSTYEELEIARSGGLYVAPIENAANDALTKMGF